MKRSPADRFHIQGPPSGAMLARVRVPNPKMALVSFCFPLKPTSTGTSQKTPICCAACTDLLLRCHGLAAAFAAEMYSSCAKQPAPKTFRPQPVAIEWTARDSPESSSSPVQTHPSAAAHAHGLTQSTLDTSSRTQSFAVHMPTCQGFRNFDSEPLAMAMGR